MLSASFKKTIAVLALGCASVGAVSSVQAGNKMSQEQLQKLFSPRIVYGLFMSVCYPVTDGNSLTKELGTLSKRAFRNVRGM